MSQLRTVSLIALFAFVSALVVVTPAHAESPWFVLIELDKESGPTIVDNRPAAVIGTQVSLDVVAGLPAGGQTFEDLRGRPYYNLKLLFGDPGTWEPYPSTPESLIRLEWDARPLVVLARFYPAIGTTSGALFVVWDMNAPTNSYRIHQPTESDLVSLSEAGVPIVVSEAGGQTARLTLIAALGVALILVLMLGGRHLVRRH